MRAVRLHEIDRERGPQLFRVEQLDDPQPGPGETLVKLRRAAFNRRDVFISQGLYPGIQLPCTPGSDGVGTVAPCVQRPFASRLGGVTATVTCRSRAPCHNAPPPSR